MIFLILQKEGKDQPPYIPDNTEGGKDGGKEGMDQPLMIFLILQKEGRRKGGNGPTSDDIPDITEGGEEEGREWTNL